MLVHVTYDFVAFLLTETALNLVQRKWRKAHGIALTNPLI